MEKPQIVLFYQLDYHERKGKRGPHRLEDSTG